MARVNCLGILVVDALSGPIDRYPEPKVRTQVVTQSVCRRHDDEEDQ